MEDETHMDTEEASNASFPADLLVAAIEAAVDPSPEDSVEEEQVLVNVKSVEDLKEGMAVDTGLASQSAVQLLPSTAPPRIVNIPYILNGELYEIQTQEGENVTVKCCYCPPDRVYRGSVRSTGNFHMHIKRRHPDLLGKLHDMKVNALLERRDRLMRNRKMPTTTSQRRGGAGSNSRINATSIKQELLQMQQQQSSSSSSPQLSLMHTHKLKIRTAFQRHQLQQQQQQLQKQQQQQQQTWDTVAAPFVVVNAPNTTEAEVQSTAEPLNYSLKQQTAGEERQCGVVPLNFNEQMVEQVEQIEKKSMGRVESNQTFETQVSMSPNTSEQRVEGFELLSAANRQPNLAIFSGNNDDQCRQQLYTNSGAAAAIMRCATSSSLSSCGSNLSTNMIDYNSNNNINYHNCSTMTATVKNEPMLLMLTPSPQTLTPTEAQQAIDMSMQSFVSSSGIGSAPGVSFESNMNMNASCGTTAATPTVRNLQWQELLLQVERSLRELQREMCARNQIETNRIFLDIAKFKYLNPGFNFQC